MQRILLVIDDEAEICLLLQRILRKSFDDIHVANNAAEAEPLLREQPITHIVCDLYLGAGEPLGNDLMQGWRARKPSIQYVALFTGSSMDLMPTYDGIDAIFQKPGGYEDLVAALKS
jgi:DNA-binding NtrC family response regulator